MPAAGPDKGARKFQALLDALLDPVFLVDPETGNILDANGAAVRWLDSERSTLLGIPFRVLFAREPENSHAELLRQVRVHGYVFAEQLFKTPTGQPRVADLTASMMDWEGGKVVLVSLRDSAERKRAREAENETIQVRAKLDLIAELSHQVNNPLQSLVNLAHQRNDEVCRESLSELVRIVERLRKEQGDPAAPQRPTAAAVPAQAAAPAPSLTPADPRRILIADDYDLIRETFTLFLHRLRGGLDIDGAADGEQAVESFKKRHHGVVILDIRMPRKTGDQAFLDIEAFCKEQGWAMPHVVFCTGYTLPNTIANRIAASPHHACLLKPVAPSEMSDVVKKFLPA
jgi:PAS domain S-box-containing protein